MNLTHTGDVFDSFQFTNSHLCHGKLHHARNLDFSGGNPDMLLLAFVLCSLIQLLWCYLLAGAARNLVFSATNRFYATLKTGILSLLVFIILVSTIAINRLPINELSDISVFLSVTRGELLKLCWYYLLSQVVFGVFVFFANHIVLNAFGIEKVIILDGAVMYCRLTAEEDE
ncbi:MAG: hypothetical protein U9N43_06610 [Euryarchaeota archaeon]|nr:hypothetical protein [Euryarchaeota archaeon]